MSKRLLLVEDEATLARAVARLLRRAGYAVFLAGTCAEARSAEGSFSLGVFDIDLPDGDGIGLAEELVARRSVRRVLFYSGTQSRERRARAARIGPFLEKSRGFPYLSAAIELALAHKGLKVAGGEDEPTGESSDPPPSGIRPGKRSG